VALGNNADEKRKLARAYGPGQHLSRMELPGIEPGPKSSLNWENTGLNYAKQRETTRNDLQIRRRR
jgi:hypothetical protein